MKGRESGMPEEDAWQGFFDARCILERLVTRSVTAGISVAEFGSGYGTFSLPLARMTSGLVHAIDIEPGLIERLSVRAASEGLNNIVPILRDFMTDGTGLPDECVDHAMLYNILHIEEPVSLLSEAYRIVRRGGSVSIIHWRTDVPTPRGPSLGIRPSPARIHSWLAEVGFSNIKDVELVRSPHHYGIKALRPTDTSDASKAHE
jgi:SAM-dependent methyltransferase